MLKNVVKTLLIQHFKIIHIGQTMSETIFFFFLNLYSMVLHDLENMASNGKKEYEKSAGRTLGSPI